MSDTLRAAAERMGEPVEGPCGFLVRFGHPAHYYGDADGVAQVCPGRAAASPAPTDSPDERCGHIFRPTANSIATCDKQPDHAGACSSWTARPAAVTAPREDERLSHDAANRFDMLANQLTHGEPWSWSSCELLGHLDRMRDLVTAAPAVERATPDPDTLTALLDRVLEPLFGPLGQITGPEVARALIAAGVTLDETTT